MTADPTGANNVVAAGANAHGARSLKAKAADEFRRFLVLFFYLWILFGVFVLNQGVVLREHGINFAMQGFAFFNALVFAKVVMLFEVFDPGRWLRKRPLIYPILYESVLLTVLFLVAHVLEKTIEGLIRGKPLTESMPLLTGAGLPGFLSIAVILFIALIPFFGLRNLSLAMGEGRLYAMIFANPSAQDGERRSGAASRSA
ncbi:MAG TPA: hypothetical protein VGO05_03460 [Roseiarcus sp.]|jgi:hypothetical protein|nr:hypothetical protein [Roseiarcus sp.]